jgi:putative addiction module killer protein
MTQKTLVDVRLTRILIDQNLGVFKKIGNIFELKFKSGIRVYYGLEENKLVLLLNGGSKNTKREQSNDIQQAKDIYKEYQNDK